MLTDSKAQHKIYIRHNELHSNIVNIFTTNVPPEINQIINKSIFFK